jgi:hypothetical protein
MKFFWLVTMLCCVFLACKKDSDDPAPNPPPNNGPGNGTDTLTENELQANALDSFLQVNSFQLTKYYSDSAIDYIDDDSVVKSETDLWAYVSTWLKDDTYTFGSDGNVTIHQNANKHPSDSSETLTRPYEVSADDDGVKISFLTNDYEPLDYRLESFSDTLIKVSAIWNGKNVKSEYTVVD